jgi:membrane-associated phospholipid phosphatase
MDGTLAWGLDFIIWVQQFSSPNLDTIFRALTFLGDEYFLLLLIPFVYWTVAPKIGVRLAIAFLLSGCLNVYLKGWIMEPRPFELNPAVKLSEASGYGMPSGHAQSSVLVWGVLAYWLNRPWAWVTAVSLMLLIGFSRIYLGVHFPTQVLAGWGVGIVFLAAYLALYPRLAAWLSPRPTGQKLLLATAVPLVLVLIYPETENVAAMGVLLGMGVGLALAERYVPETPLGSWGMRALRYAVGVAVIFAIFLGLRVVLPGEASALYAPFRFLRYGLIGLWVTLGGPWLFSLWAFAPRLRSVS